MIKKLVLSLTALWAVLHFASLYAVFVLAPEENIQGIVQKIFYYHVSSAFSMYLGFGVSGLGALLYLIYRDDFWDDVSHAGASVGLLFCSMVLVSGPLWARPIWGTWWTWDPRLTTTLMIWLIFVAVLLLRHSFDRGPRGQIFASVLTLIGLIDLPLIFFSVKIWRGIHPQVLGQENSMPGEMRLALVLSMLSLLLLAILLLMAKTKTLQLQRREIS